MTDPTDLAALTLKLDCDLVIATIRSGFKTPATEEEERPVPQPLTLPAPSPEKEPVPA